MGSYTTNLNLEKASEGTVPFDDALNTNMDVLDRLFACSADVAGLTCTGATSGWKRLNVKRDDMGNISVTSAGLAVGRNAVKFSASLAVANSGTFAEIACVGDIRGTDAHLSGSLTVAGSGTFTGIACSGDVEAKNARLSGTLNVNGSSDFADAVSIGKTLLVSGTLTALGDVNIGDDLSVTGSANLSGGLNVTGEVRTDTLRIDTGLTSGFGPAPTSGTVCIPINYNGTVYYVPATTTMV